jgi:hypothetical protein
MGKFSLFKAQALLASPIGRSTNIDEGCCGMSMRLEGSMLEFRPNVINDDDHENTRWRVGVSRPWPSLPTPSFYGFDDYGDLRCAGACTDIPGHEESERL